MTYAVIHNVNRQARPYLKGNSVSAGGRPLNKVRAFSLEQAAFSCHKLCYARPADGASADPEAEPRRAGSYLIGSTAAAIVIGVVIGPARRFTAWGFLIGAILGIPIGAFMTYRRYGHAL